MNLCRSKVRQPSLQTLSMVIDIVYAESAARPPLERLRIDQYVPHPSYFMGAYAVKYGDLETFLGAPAMWKNRAHL